MPRGQMMVQYSFNINAAGAEQIEANIFHVKEVIILFGFDKLHFWKFCNIFLIIILFKKK